MRRKPSVRHHLNRWRHSNKYGTSWNYQEVKEWSAGENGMCNELIKEWSTELEEKLQAASENMERGKCTS